MHEKIAIILWQQRNEFNLNFKKKKWEYVFFNKNNRIYVNVGFHGTMIKEKNY